MLTQYDIDVMESEIQDIIESWGYTLKLLVPLPIVNQPNYNKLLGEYSGDVIYDTILIPAERKDVQNMITDSIVNNKYGDAEEGTLMFTIPSSYKYLIERKSDCVILYDNDRWYIRDIRTRIGEYIIGIKKLAGNIDTWGK